MVIILSGTSGSGKSTVADILRGLIPFPKYISEELAAYLMALKGRCDPNSIVVASADNSFMKDGEYVFNPALLPMAHNACLRRFTDTLLHQDGNIPLVDNTNTTLAEIAPYIALGNAYSDDVQVITLIRTPSDCAVENKHKVSENVIIKQHVRLMQRSKDWPAFWPKQNIFYI